MSGKNKRDEEQSKQETKIEDLPVEQSKQEEIKGGKVPHLLRIIE